MTSDSIDNDRTMSGSEGTLLANRYRIVRQLGQGGMGSVWLAEDTQLDNKQFAIKMLPSILVSNKRAYNQLKSEAIVAMKLVHPNIVQIRAFEENDGNPFLVMDYIDGQTLDDYLADVATPSSPSRNGGDAVATSRLSEQETIRILKPIAAALDFAHSQGVVHRDVKPANIMIRKDGVPFILDFGISREMQETMTRVTGKLSSGTLLYMSPEQLNGDAPKPAQDVYSFAALAYECLKGSPPFAHGQIEFQIMNKAPEPLAGGPRSCAGAIMSGLSKRPEGRPATCSAVLAAPQIPRRPRAVRVPVAPPARRRPPFDGVLDHVPQALGSRGAWFLPACGAVLLFVVVGAVLYGNHRRHEEARERMEAWRKAEIERQRKAEDAKRLEDERREREVQLARQEKERMKKEAERQRIAEDNRARDSVSEIKIESSVQKGKMERISDADGFKKNLDEVADIFTRAETLFNAGKWHAAAAAYTNYVERCRALSVVDGDRQAATSSRKKAKDAFTAAEADGAKTYAANSWKDAVKVLQNAAAQFRKMNFPAAGSSFEDAARQFAESGRVAREQKKLAEARQAEEKRDAEKRREEAKQKEVASRQFIAACEADDVDAVKRLLGSIDFGNARVQYWLGELYFGGKGVRQNYSEGIRWFRKSAAQGDALGQVALGSVYENGNGVPQDSYEAVRWYRKAAEQGDAIGQAGLGGMYLLGSGGLPCDYAEALRLVRKSVGQGNSSGQKVLGVMYANGWGVDKDLSEAVRWYRKSAEQNDAGGQYLLGLMYENGFGIGKSRSQAVYWYRKAAELGDNDAKEALGRLGE